MRQLWQALLRHPMAIAVFSLLWLVTWGVTVLTWERDAAGYSIGMAPGAIPLHLILPILLGGVVGLYATNPPGVNAKGCTLAGLALGLVQFGVLSIVDFLWLPAAEPGLPIGDLVAGTLVGAVAYAGVCAVLGVLGGGIRAGLGAMLHQRSGAETQHR